MEYVVNYTVVTFCNTLSKIVQTFPPYFVKTPHIIRYICKPLYYNYDERIIISEQYFTTGQQPD